jgi:hypothetical protein
MASQATALLVQRRMGALGAGPVFTHEIFSRNCHPAHGGFLGPGMAPPCLPPTIESGGDKVGKRAVRQLSVVGRQKRGIGETLKSFIR